MAILVSMFTSNPLLDLLAIPCEVNEQSLVRFTSNPLLGCKVKAGFFFNVISLFTKFDVIGKRFSIQSTLPLIGAPSFSLIC